MYNKKDRPDMESFESISDIAQLPYRDWPERSIEQKTMKHFGVKMAVSQEDGTTPTAVYFPVTNDGQLVGYKKRDLTKPKLAKGHFTFIGSVSVDCDMFGQNKCTGGKKIVFTTGELDAMALWQEMKSRYPKGNPSVVSVIMGDSNAAKNIAHNHKFWDKYSDKITCFDQDRATPQELEKGIMKGWDATAEVCSLYPDFLHVEFDEKDANDMIVHGKGEEIFWAVMKHAKKFRPEDVVSGSEIDLEELMKPLPKGLDTPYPLLNKMLGGLRTGELYISCAGSGAGKTTGAREIAYHTMTGHSENVGIIFLEEPFMKTAKSFVALHNNIPHNKLVFKPDLLPKEKWEKAHTELFKTGRFFGVNHFGSLTTDTLMQKLRYLRHVCGCKHIFFDHISMAVSGIESTNERKDIDYLMTQLAAFVVETDTMVWAIVHLKRPSGKQSASEGGQVSLTDLRGSGGLEQLAFQVVAYERNTQAEDEADKHRGQFRVLKNRTMGSLGIADECFYDITTGRLKPLEQEF